MAEIACTLGGDDQRARIAQWRAVLARARRREPVDGGVRLAYDPEPDLLAELARLTAAEHACCGFLSFTLSVSAAGTAFTVTAPPDAAPLVAEIFG
jgi:hypothetical protein